MTIYCKLSFTAGNNVPSHIDREALGEQLQG
jgi:hypothetical protein